MTQERDLDLCLYVAGSVANSGRAIANLNYLCECYLQEQFQVTVDVVNVLTDPRQALSEGILVTPTLVKRTPAPRIRIIGDLSETQAVLRALQIEVNFP